MKTRIVWMPILGAVGAVIFVKITDYFFGRNASFIALGGLLFSWCLVHLFYENQLDKLEAHLLGLDGEKRQELLSQISPELRKDIERRAEAKRLGKP